MLTIEIHYTTMRCDYSKKRAVMARFKRSFGKGVGSIMSLQGSHTRLSLGDARTDAEQLRSDWGSVGRDIHSAILKAKK